MLSTLALAVLASLPAAPQISTAEIAYQNLLKRATARLAIETKKARGGIPIAVDDRVELLSTIFRLAGSDEFASEGFEDYTRALDERFKPFAGHPAVQFAREMREKRGMSADAVAGLAIHLRHLPTLVPRRDLKDSNVEPSWRADEATKFAELAADFAKASRFAEFFRRSRPLYQLSEVRMRTLVNKDIDTEWFASYFGERQNQDFRVALGLLNGSISYGVKAKVGTRPEELYAVLGTWLFDAQGLPRYDGSVTATIVHEFCHSCVDPAVGRHKLAFEPVGTKIKPELATVVPVMGQYYWKTLFDESLVRAVVVRYLDQKIGRRAADAEAEQQRKYGFLWVGDLAEYLKGYELERTRYPNFDSYLPRVVEYFEKLPAKLPQLGGVKQP